jgi:DNA-binding NtrC family response regulator
MLLTVILLLFTSTCNCQLRSSWRGRWFTVKSIGGGVRVLAVVPEEMQQVLLKQLAPLNMTVVCAQRALEITRLVGKGAVFHVALLPAAPSDAEWWASWGELSLAEPRPEVLVYARATSFQLWTGVLDMGGFDVVVQPFSEAEIQDAVLRAVRCFQGRAKSARSRRKVRDTASSQ